MKTSDQIDRITAAVAAVQAKAEAVTKNKTVEVSGEKAQWKSAYATLATLDAAVRPAIIDAGIALVQSIEAQQGGPVLVTRIALADQWFEVQHPIKPSRDGAQGFGGGISFARRWALCAIFNLVPDDIEEGQGYKDAAREGKQPRRAAAPGGLGALLSTITDAPTIADIEKAARAARSAHPAGEASTSVERTISARVCTALDNADTPEALDEIRGMLKRLQPRGIEVRDALGRAGRRMRGEV